MATNGPVPNRQGDYSRPDNEKRAAASGPGLKRGKLRKTKAPEPSPEWDEVALMIYESLKTSGQEDWFQDSDWAFAFLLCDEITKYRRQSQTRANAQMLATLMSGMASLCMTEGDRRRARIELEEDSTSEEDSVRQQIELYRNGLGLIPGG